MSGWPCRTRTAPKNLGLKKIVELVGRHLPAEDGWWQQMVTVAYEKAAGKSRVSLQHSKLGNADEAAALKAHWGERLDTLKALLEG